MVVVVLFDAHETTTRYADDVDCIVVVAERETKRGWNRCSNRLTITLCLQWPRCHVQRSMFTKDTNVYLRAQDRCLCNSNAIHVLINVCSDQ